MLNPDNEVSACFFCSILGFTCMYIYIYIYPLQFYYISFYDGKTKTGASLKHLLLFQSHQISSVQFSSVAQSCLTLCNPMNRSTPGLPVHPQLPEFTQTHVHGVSDAIQPSHPLSSPSLSALNLSQHQGPFE